eukprot:12913366-Alexandrium_andersonii.AAC.1
MLPAAGPRELLVLAPVQVPRNLDVPLRQLRCADLELAPGPAHILQPVQGHNEHMQTRSQHDSGRAVLNWEAHASGRA